jgi:hypothetical protein
VPRDGFAGADAHHTGASSTADCGRRVSSVRGLRYGDSMHGTMTVSMRGRLLNALRRAFGTQGLTERLSLLQTEIDALHHQLTKSNGGEPAPGSLQDDISALRSKMEEIGKYEVLPGAAASRFAVPLDRAPSRHLRPRWGHIQPPIAPLLEWIASRGADYHERLEMLRSYAPQLAAIRRDHDGGSPAEPAWVGGPYSAFDAAALYAMVADKRPKTFVEIGAGAAAAFARRAIGDHGLDTRIVLIDPEPHPGVEAICDTIVRRGLETADLSVFDELQDGDVVFVDSSHRAFMNSDVTAFMIDVLPRLKPGVLIQVHEIHLPWDYPDRSSDRYWSEAYILAAYLVGARDRVVPVLPTAWVTRGAQFAGWFATPLVDLGDANGLWRAGSALWFTHRA